MDEVKDTSIDALKAQLKGVIILNTSVKVTDEDEDLDGHNYVPSSVRTCDHACSSGLKTTLDASNDNELCEPVTVLEKSVMDIASFVEDERLRKIEKNKKKHQGEELKEEKAVDEENVKEEEEAKDEERKAEEEAENKEKTEEK
ncbi:uncharacterized protein LOC124890543 [Capsicum annuum]|uniref:uncharacterized protein LOC124890543 n=1 Tax=Capsicum annuum TaxID=4072 RepID=UPI001FB0CE1A|nr:uncharacterized protein LOC124890543 [Capsicum annuum]